MTRNTADYQRADSAHYIHPFTDSKALGTGARIIQRAEGVICGTVTATKFWTACRVCGASTSATVAANWLRRRQNRWPNCLTTTVSFSVRHHRRLNWPNLWHRLRRLDLIAYFSPAPVPKPTIRSYAWCGDTGNCAGSPSARLSYRATTLITAAQWRGLRWAAWRPCTRKAVCPYRTSPTSGSRIGLAKGVHTRRMNLV